LENNKNPPIDEIKGNRAKTYSVSKEFNIENNNISKRGKSIELNNPSRKSINSADLRLIDKNNSKSLISVYSNSKDRITVNFSKIFLTKKRLSW